jgi:ATP adenylyltransferase
MAAPRTASKKSGSAKNKALKKSASKSVAKKSKGEGRWPTERAVLFKPDRLKYVRKMIKPEGCVFCAASAKGVGAESLLLYRGEHAIIVMNKFPYNPGHVLILPRRHCGEFLELTDAEHTEINQMLRRVVAALKEVYNPAGFNVGLNLGAASGAGIPEHLHFHVVPRWSGDTNFFPLLAQTKVVVETLEQTFERLLPYFQNN